MCIPPGQADCRKRETMKCPGGQVDFVDFARFVNFVHFAYFVDFAHFADVINITWPGEAAHT